MKCTINLSVPNPCTEKWGSFAPTTAGGFCSRCQKNVIDFTKVADDEIYLFFKNKPAHACGRFHASQLKTYSDYIREPYIVPGLALLKAGFLSLLFMLIDNPASAQGEPTKQKKELINKSDTSNKTASKEEFSVSGTVLSEEDGLPLPGVDVVIKGSAFKGITHGTNTDADGQFSLSVKEGAILLFEFIGLKTQEYIVRSSNEPIQIKLGLDMMQFDSSVLVFTGEVNVDGVYTSHQSRLKKAWMKFKQLF